MKHIKALSLLLVLTLILTACSENDGNSSEAEISQITQSTPQSTSSAVQSSSIPEEISEPEILKFPVVIYPNMTVKADGELGEIKKTLEGFGIFYGTYLFMDMYQNYLFEENAERFTEEITENGKTYPHTFAKVSNCGITTYSAMTEKLGSLFTEKCLNDTAREIRNRFRAGENDELFVQQTGAGGYLGDSYIRINEITRPDSETIFLDMSVVGKAEDWGYEQDRVEDFSVTLKCTPSGLKIDGFGGEKLDFYPFTLGFLQYNNVFLELDNRTEFEIMKDAEHEVRLDRYYRPLNETEEMLKLLEDNAKPGETPAESSALYLDSLEYPDENSILITVSSRSAHEDGIWEKASARFTRTAEGLRLADCDEPIFNRFANYKEIFISE